MPACAHKWDKTTNACSVCSMSRVAYESNLRAGLAAAQERCERLARKVSELKAELRWYGDRENWKRGECSWSEGSTHHAGFQSPVERDGGARARKAVGE